VAALVTGMIAVTSIAQASRTDLAETLKAGAAPGVLPRGTTFFEMRW